MNILFITWDSPNVSYLESLFLPIFERLQHHGFKFYVLQFTWGNKSRVELTREACEEAGVYYRSVKVCRRPITLGSLFTAIIGARIIRKAIRELSIDTLMPRSILPALACMLALRHIHLPVVFDADGLPLDERIDFAGASPSSLVYRFLRDVEAEMVRRAERVLTRSHKAVDILLARAGAGTLKEKFHVVSNGRDSSIFKLDDESWRKDIRLELGIEISAPLLVYSGSLGEQYCLNEMFQLFELIKSRRSDVFLLVLTGQPEIAINALSTLPPTIKEATLVKMVSSQDVPRYLAASDLGLAFRRQSFSMQAVAPIKIGEYLLCGVPIVAMRYIGDDDAIGEGVGFFVETLDSIELDRIAEWFCEQVLKDREEFAIRCRVKGCELFSIEASFENYKSAFKMLKNT